MSKDKSKHTSQTFISYLAFAVTDLRIMVKLTVQNCQTKVSVVPSTATLVIKALKEPEHNWKKTKNIKHNGNISLDDVIEIAKVMKPRSMAKDLIFFFFLVWRRILVGL